MSVLLPPSRLPFNRSRLQRSEAVHYQQSEPADTHYQRMFAERCSASPTASSGMLLLDNGDGKNNFTALNGALNGITHTVTQSSRHANTYFTAAACRRFAVV
jgi:hypothetical protein